MNAAPRRSRTTNEESIMKVKANVKAGGITISGAD
jgi:hypothetical protein